MRSLCARAPAPARRRSCRCAAGRAEWSRHGRPAAASPTRRTSRSASVATTSPPRSATTRSSSSRARPAPGRPPSCPKICLELGPRRGSGLIGHTQPRRIAARSVAERIAVGARHRARRPGGLPGPLHRQDLARQPGQADDRRHPARRAAARPAAAQVRHDHHRRGPRAQPEHRLPARLPQAAAAAAPGPQADHHLGDHRPRALRAALRRPARDARADHRGLGRTYPVEIRYRPLVEVPENDEEGEAVVRDQTEAIVAATRS